MAVTSVLVRKCSEDPGGHRHGNNERHSYVRVPWKVQGAPEAWAQMLAAPDLGHSQHHREYEAQHQSTAGNI